MLKLQCSTVRNQILMQELDEEKRKVLIKYNLQCNSDLFWERPKGKYPQKIFLATNL